jgi:FKBP-type peptidyl-prolyl cis-trans isomerase
MKTMLAVSAALTGLITLSSVAREATDAPVERPDKAKVSYAMGMNLGFQRQESDSALSTEIYLQGLKDSLENKPQRFPEAEILAALNQTRATQEGTKSLGEREKEKISYGLGMRLGEQLKRAGTEVDADDIAQGMRDVLEGKPTKLKQSELQPLFKQAKAYGLAQQSKNNKTAGQTFLEKHAKEPGIQVLPDGLQYRVIAEGTGPQPTTNDMVYIKMRGTFVDNKQFIKHGNYLTRCGGGCKGWQDALPRMKIGSKWQIVIPPDLGFGEEGEAAWGVGPDATMIFDLEMVSIAPPNAEFGRGRLGHAFEDSDISDPPPASAK